MNRGREGDKVPSRRRQGRRALTFIGRPSTCDTNTAVSLGQVTCAWCSPSCLVVADTRVTVVIWSRVMSHPLSCVPLLSGHYPASSLV